jgi:hypothetical protein
LYRLFGCPLVFESKHCAVIQTSDDGYAFGRFLYPRHAFEQIATYKCMAEAKRAFDAYNKITFSGRKAEAKPARCLEP